MKKILVVLLSLMILSLSSLSAFASDVQVVIDEQVLEFADQKPYIDENDRTMVPVRVPMEALGAAVDWDAENNQAILEKDGVVVVFTIGSATYTINDEEFEMDTIAVTTGDRTCIPIRYAAEALGATVGWDGETYIVKITSEVADVDVDEDVNEEEPVEENTEEENVTDEDVTEEKVTEENIVDEVEDTEDTATDEDAEDAENNDNVADGEEIE
jgi:hypothetical protein